MAFLPSVRTLPLKTHPPHPSTYSDELNAGVLLEFYFPPAHFTPWVFYVRTLCQKILLRVLAQEQFASLDFPPANHNVTGRDKIGERKTLMFVLHDEFVTRLDYIFRKKMAFVN
jgi:hypothetical protein